MNIALSDSSVLSFLKLQIVALSSGIYNLRKSRFFSCSVASVFQFGGAQVIRLIGNLILTRLLMPEVFGLMAIVQTVIVGLNLVSDIGLIPVVVNRKEEPDARFLNTIWTLQILRGLGLFVVSCLLSYPVSVFYENRALLYLIPSIGFVTAIGGFKSVSVGLLNRQMKQWPLTLEVLSSSIITITFAAIISIYWPSVWALVIGQFAGVMLSLCLTHIYARNHKHRFLIDEIYLKEILSFAKWLLIGTAFTFIASEGDRLLIGKFLSLHELGVYAIAFYFSRSLVMLVKGLSAHLLFPAMSEAFRQGENQLNPKLLKWRFALLSMSLLGLSILSFQGSFIINALYDNRYMQSGHILEILSIGIIPAILRSFHRASFLAAKKSSVSMTQNIIEAISVSIIPLYGVLNFGMDGFLYGYVSAQFISYVASLYLCRKQPYSAYPMDQFYIIVSLLIGYVSIFHF